MSEKINNTANGSTAAAQSFLSTTAGKLTIALMAVFTIAAVVTGFVLLAANDDNEDDEVDTTAQESEEESNEDSTNQTTPTPMDIEVTPTEVDEQEETPQNTNVNVYFYNPQDFPQGDPNEFLTPVSFTTKRADVATYAIEQIIQGPTAEQSSQYSVESTFPNQVDLQGESNCGGGDFTINVERGLATVKFCKDAFFTSDFSGGVVRIQIEETLKQFSTVDKVLVLDNEKQCFGDLRGNVDHSECTY